MRLRVVDKVLVATDTVRIRLCDAQGRALPAFTPGAHVELRFADFSRHYSLTSSPARRDVYEICVLRDRTGRGGSVFLHDHLDVGAHLDAEGPVNTFPLGADAAYTALIAGGIGVTPLLTMAEALTDANRPFEFHYAARSPEHFLDVPVSPDRLHRYPNRHDRPTIDVEAILAGLPTGSHVYVCGPAGLIRAVRARASTLQWDPGRIHSESFGSPATPGGRAITVRLAQSGHTIEVAPDLSILDALLAEGIWIPSDCRRGECGACVTQVVDGTPEHRDVCLPDALRRDHMCPCVSRAAGSQLTLDL